ncbi:MAG: hypothetical protein M3297_16690, partial [Thermoproteota archaeon]|nr:hypothetical protein [Thermoproteota archaeon]
KIYGMSKTIGIPTLTLISISFLLAIIPGASPYITSVFAQNITESQENNGKEQTLHIIKDATNSYTISSDASFVGSFDTTYSIVGDPRFMEASKDLIISTVTEDFGNSPTIGYVNNTNTSSASQVNLNQQPSLPNPFATKADIDKKIWSEITTSIDNAAKSDSAEGEIKCIFGSSLDDFKCGFHRLSG